MSVISAWSYSRWALYKECPLKFKFIHIDKLKEPKSEALARGLAVHHAIAAYLNGEGDVPPEVTGKLRPLYAEIRATDNKVVERQMGFTREWKPTGWFADDTWLRVAWDVGVMYDDMTGEVIDHKTGRAYRSNTDQMELFALSFFCQYAPAEAVTARLIYVDTGDQQFAEFKRSQKAELTKKWETAIAPMFNDTEFAPRPNDKCRFCAFARKAGGQCKFG